MRNPLRSIAVVALAAAAAVLAVPTAASAAVTTVGYDVSYPQCGKSLPSARAFGLVGVNGGLATTANTCLSQQLTWASKSSGLVKSQPKIQLYLNTANPGQVTPTVGTWPKASPGGTPYGSCAGANDMACSWQYGWERANNSDVSFFRPAASAARLSSLPSRYRWWLDVETDNSWQIGSTGTALTAAQARNRATIEGMTSYLVGQGATVGFYSTGSQWSQIVGSVPTTSSLVKKNSWLAGATSSTSANALCTSTPLVAGGRVALTQYVQNQLDRDHACG